MSTLMLHARWRARLHADERGFSLIEAMIAITIIFGSLTALAYTATTGFRYVAYAREKQAANGIANQVMEEIRGLVYSNIQQGLSSGPAAGPNPLASDPNVVTGCPADNAGVYRFVACSGEQI